MRCPNCGKSLCFVRDFCPFCKTQVVAPRRPRSVTVVSWLAIVSGIGQAFVVLSPPGREVMAGTSTSAHFLTFASVTLLTISGVVMLRGFNWARWVFIVTVGYNQLSKVFAGHASILGLLLIATAYFYLFRPAADAFFSGAALPDQKLPEAAGETQQMRAPQPPGEPGAPPNDGPAKRVGNSGKGGGPPSVS